MNEPAAASVDYRAVAGVASRSALQRVRLRHCTAELTTDPDAFPARWDEMAFIGFQARVVGAPDDDGRFATQAAFLAVFRRGEHYGEGSELARFDDEDPPDLLIEVVFDLEYLIEPTAVLEDGDLQQFALANSTLHAWPYWRELAQSMTTRMMLPPLVIGTYKLPSAFDPPGDVAEPSDGIGG